MKPTNLRTTRETLGLSVEGMARALGCSGDSLRRWERGDAPGSVQLLCDLAASVPSVAEEIKRRGAALPMGRPKAA
jgi:transcriptional regulator with XRE-family HTH domain